MRFSLFKIGFAVVLVLYCFDRVELFRLLESWTTVRNRPEVSIESQAEDGGLRVSARRHTADEAEPVVALGLGIRGVGGDPKEVQLELTSKAGRVSIWIEAADGVGSLLVYRLGEAECGGRVTCSAEVGRPCANADGQISGGESAVLLPITPLRLMLAIGAGCDRLEVILHRICVTGDAHRVPVGLANG